MGPFRLNVLGSPQLLDSRGDLVRFKTAKHFALLIFLAVEKTFPHRRERLADMLWPGKSTQEARHSLATAISMIRSKLGRTSFDNTRDTVKLTAGVVTTDVESLQLDAITPATTSRLGRFLDGFHAGELPDFIFWCDAQTARYLPRILNATTSQLAHAASTGNLAEMERLAASLLRLDNLNEAARCALIDVALLNGDRLGALRQYEAYRNMLSEELGALPPEALSKTISRLRLGSLPSLLPPPRRTQDVAATPSSMLLGRTTEMAKCLDRYDLCCDGSPAHALVTGPSGAGKSAFLKHALATVALKGARVVRVDCHHVEGLLPFGIVLELLGQLVSIPEAAAAPPEVLSGLSRFLPAVRERFRSLPTPSTCAIEDDIEAFSTLLLSLITVLSTDDPLVLGIDDFHFADTHSQSLLHKVLRSITSARLMVLLVRDETTAEQVDSLAAWRAGSTRTHLEIITLSPLGPEDTAAIVRQLVSTPEQLTPADLRAIFTGAGGNPGALHVLASDWNSHGSMSIAVSRFWPDFRDRASLSPIPRVPAPRTYRCLSKDAQVVAQFAAVLNQGINDPQAYLLLGLSQHRVMASMTELLAEGVLAQDRNGVGFCNEVVRKAIYAGIAIPIRTQLHRRFAQYLISAQNDSTGITRLDIAHHLIMGACPREASPFLLTGGTEAIRYGAPAEAASALSAGLTLFFAESRDHAVLTLAEAKQEMGLWSESQALLDANGRELAGDSLQRANVLRATNERFLGYLNGTRLDEAVETLFTVAVTKELTPAIRATSVSSLTAIVSSSRQQHHIGKLSDISAELMSLPLEPWHKVHVLHARAWCLAQQAGPAAALPLLLAGSELISQARICSSIASRLLLGTGVTLCQVGRYADAAPTLERAHNIAHRLGNAALTANAASGLALVYGRLGDPEAQIDHALEAIHAFGRDEWGICMLSSVFDYCIGLASVGRSGEAESAASEYDCRFDRRRPPWIQQAWSLCKADIYALVGNERKAFHAGRIGTSGEFAHLFHECFAGQYARWVALSGIRTGTAAGALARLKGEIECVDRHDAKDQVEILASIALMENAIGRGSTADWIQVERKMAALPTATQSMIRRLGVNPSSNSVHRGLASSPPG